MLAVRDLQGAGGGAGQELLTSSSGSHILPTGVGQGGASEEGSGVLLRSRLEEEGDRASRHPEIHTETTRGETKINNLLRGVLLIAYNILGVIVEEEYMATYVLAG